MKFTNFSLYFEMTNENSSYSQSFPVNVAGSQTDNRRTLSVKVRFCWESTASQWETICSFINIGKSQVSWTIDGLARKLSDIDFFLELIK
jgi:hypothetical protein